MGEVIGSCNYTNFKGGLVELQMLGPGSCPFNSGAVSMFPAGSAFLMEGGSGAACSKVVVWAASFVFLASE